MKNIYKFEIQGYLQEFDLDEESIDAYPENGINYRKLVEYFYERSHKIEHEIEHRIRRSLNDRVEGEFDVNVHLRYEVGSFEWYGVIEIIDWVGRFITSAAIISYLSKLIRISVNREIESQLRNTIKRKRLVLNTEVIAIPSIVSDPSRRNKRTSDENNSEYLVSTQLFSLRTILIAITLFNVIMFVGGTVYNSFSISSIQDKHKEAIELIQSSKENYQKSLIETNQIKNTVNTQVADYLKNIESSNKSKIDSIATKLIEREKEINGDMDALSTRVEVSKGSFKDTENDVNGHVDRLKGIITKLENFEKEDLVIGVENFFDYTDWFFRIFIISGVLLIFISVFKLLIYAFKKIFD